MGDFINDKYLTLIYKLDFKDIDDVKKNYKVVTFPTFIFIDDKGVELTRMFGGSSSPDEFISMLKEATAPTNAWAYYKQEIVKDHNKTIDYVLALEKAGVRDQSDSLLKEFLTHATLKESVAPKYIEYIEKAHDINSPLIINILANQKEADKILGEGAVEELILPKYNTKLTPKHLTNTLNSELEKYIAMGDSYTVLQQAPYHFTKSNLESIKNRDLDTLIKVSTKSIKGASEELLQSIYAYLTISLKAQKVANKEGLQETKTELAPLLTKIQTQTQNPTTKTQIQKTLDSL